MSKREDYLDDLLNSINSSKDEIDDLLFEPQNESDLEEEENQKSMDIDLDEDDFQNSMDMDLKEKDFLEDLELDEEDFLKDVDMEDIDLKNFDLDEDDFLKDLDLENFDIEDDDFLKNFEQEISNLEEDSEEKKEEESFDDVMVDTMGMEEFSDPDMFLSDDTDENLDESLSLNDLLPEEQIEEEKEAEEEWGEELVNTLDEDSIEKVEEDGNQDILDILAGLSDEEEVSGETQEADPFESGEEDLEAIFSNLSEITDETGELEEIPEKEVVEKKKKEGFFQKMAEAIFGDDEEDSEEDDVSEEEKAALKAEKLNEKKQKKLEKEEKKKAKKQEAEEKKKEKERNKPVKPKKEKPPKEKTKPLPKGPVILIFVMAISVIILVNLSSSLIGYTMGIDTARNYYSRGNYVEAYGALSGMNIKEADQDFYQKVKISAVLQKEWESYDIYAKANMHPEALNALVLSVGKYDEFIPEAKEAGLEEEYEKMIEDIKNALSQYSMNMDQAREMYTQYDRADYTVSLHNIIKETGWGY